MKKKHRFNARDLRALLIALLVIVLSASGAIFYFGYQHIQELSASAKSTAEKVGSSNSGLQTIIQTKKVLNQNQDVIAKAATIAASGNPSSEQISAEINRIAEAAGITISNIDSGNQPDQNQPSLGNKPVGEPNPGRGLTVTLQSPVSYRNLLDFLYGVEHSSLQIDISGVNLSVNSNNRNSGQVNIEPLTIEVKN